MARSAKVDVLEKFRFGVSWSDDSTFSESVELLGADTTLSSTLKRAGFHDVQLPKRSTNIVSYREGTDPDIMSKSAGLSTMEDVVLSRGLIRYDEDFKEFSSWAAKIHAANDTTSKLDYTVDKSRGATGDYDYRKEVLIWMYDRQGVVVRAWKLFNAFPSNYTPGSDLSASEDGEKSLEQLTLAYEDFMEILPDGTNNPPADERPSVN